MDIMSVGDYSVSLISSVINDTPAPPPPDNISLADLYKFARRHMVSSIVYHALIGLGLTKEEISPFYEDYKEFSLREAGFAAQTERLLSAFEKNKIAAMPFKGTDIKKYYPHEYMRASVDTDILIDGKDSEIIDRIMTENGFSCNYNTDKEISYIKKPYFNYELHKRVIESSSPYYAHFADILHKSPLEKNMSYIHKMSFEEAFIFSTVHFNKHFKGGGAGIRFLLDLYLLEKNAPADADMSYIYKTLKNMGLYGFFKKMSDLSKTVFGADLSKRGENDTAVCRYLYLQGCFGGDSGCILETVTRKSKKHKRLKYFYFLWYKFMFQERRFKYYPILKKYYLLLPFCVLHRMFKSAVIDRKSVKQDYKKFLKYEEFVGNVFSYCEVI